jgi:hypothetical protein
MREIMQSACHDAGRGGIPLGDGEFAAYSPGIVDFLGLKPSRLVPLSAYRFFLTSASRWSAQAISASSSPPS